TSGEERLKDVFENLRGHAAAGVAKHQLRHFVALAQVDGQDAAFIHAVQGVDDQVEDDRLDLLRIYPGFYSARRFEDDLASFIVLQVLDHIEYRLNKFGELGGAAFAVAATAELQQPLGDRFAAESLLLNHAQIFADDFAVLRRLGKNVFHPALERLAAESDA